MSEQNNTENKSNLQNRIVRVVCIELAMSKTNALKFIPSSFLPEVIAYLEQAYEIELRLKIDNQIEEIHTVRMIG